MNGRHPRPVIAALLSTVLVLMSGTTATAATSIGAAIGSRPIALEHTAQPGHSYRLPATYVENSGTVPARYELRIERLSTGSGHAVPTSWVVPARNHFLLGPHKAVYVPLTLRVPGNAASGGYLSDLVAAAGPAHAVHGTALGAAAATKLTFDVSDPGFHVPGWLASTLIALAAAVLLTYAVRRSGLRVRLEHRGA